MKTLLLISTLFVIGCSSVCHRDFKPDFMEQERDRLIREGFQPELMAPTWFRRTHYACDGSYLHTVIYRDSERLQWRMFHASNNKFIGDVEHSLLAYEIIDKYQAFVKYWTLEHTRP